MFIYTRQNRNAYSKIFLFFEVRSNILAISFKQFCSPIIHQFKPENSFDVVQIGVSNHSLNTGGVKTKCHRCFNNYEVWPQSAPDTLFTVDNFNDGDFQTKKRETKR